MVRRSEWPCSSCASRQLDMHAPPPCWQTSTRATSFAPRQPPQMTGEAHAVLAGLATICTRGRGRPSQGAAQAKLLITA